MIVVVFQQNVGTVDLEKTVQIVLWRNVVGSIKNNLTESVRNYDLSIIDPVINIIDNKRAFLLLLEKTEEKKLSASENDQVLEG